MSNTAAQRSGTGTAPLVRAAATEPDGTALTVAGATRTWGELEDRSRMVAAALAADGVDTGRRVAILARNSVEWGELIMGTLRAGVPYVPVNWHLTAGEVRYLLDDSGAEVVFCDSSTAELAAEALDGSTVSVIEFGSHFEDWIDGRRAVDDAPVGGFPLLYTGGTTGRSKGVVRPSMATHSPADIRDAWQRWGDLIQVPEDGACLVTTPIYHAFATAMVGTSFARGLPVVATTSFDTEQWLRLVETHHISTAPVVPTQIVRLVKLPAEVRAGYNTSSLRHVVHTAAPCPPWAKRALIDWLGPVVWEFYGSSEGTGPVLVSSEEWLDHPGTIGRPVGGLEASVVDADGRDLAPGEVGTLYFRRSDGAPGYHDDPEKTEASRLPDGRFTVGDLGWMDGDGYLYLADRRVDLIITGGANVYPAEVEAVLVEHPAVGDAAVFGIPHPEWGQEVKAAVELAVSPRSGTDDGGAEETVTEDDLIAWCRDRLASFKCPRSVDFHDELPREAHGKLKKRFLRDPYWKDT